MSQEKKATKTSALWINYLLATAGWLACAALCLALTVKLEEFPHAYDVLFPAALLLLFGNIFVFLFIASRWSDNTRRLSMAVGRVCLAETIFVVGIYCIGRFFIGM